MSAPPGIPLGFLFAVIVPPIGMQPPRLEQNGAAANVRKIVFEQVKTIDVFMPPFAE